jgi:hypothetical protein
MKNTTLGFFGALVLAGGMFLTGCADECKDVICTNGECVAGDCVCDAGYEGLDCSVALNAKFSGTYGLTETCQPSGQATYSITVAPKSGSQTLVNFTGLWEEAQAIVSAEVAENGTSFTIASQPLGTRPETISGSGTITADGGTITLNYTIALAGATVDVCSGSLTK